MQSLGCEVAALNTVNFNMFSHASELAGSLRTDSLCRQSSRIWTGYRQARDGRGNQ